MGYCNLKLNLIQYLSFFSEKYSMDDHAECYQNLIGMAAYRVRGSWSNIDFSVKKAIKLIEKLVRKLGNEDVWVVDHDAYLRWFRTWTGPYGWDPTVCKYCREYYREVFDEDDDFVDDFKWKDPVIPGKLTKSANKVTC